MINSTKIKLIKRLQLAITASLVAGTIDALAKLRELKALIHRMPPAMARQAARDRAWRWGGHYLFAFVSLRNFR